MAGHHSAETAKNSRNSIVMRAASDQIDDAAAVLTKKAYPFMKQVPWSSDEFMLTPGKADPIGWAKAIGKIIDMGASMDGELVKAGLVTKQR
jgi:hypothetical protein